VEGSICGESASAGFDPLDQFRTAVVDAGRLVVVALKLRDERGLDNAHLRLIREVAQLETMEARA
jgi:hypothetical protein